MNCILKFCGKSRNPSIGYSRNIVSIRKEGGGLTLRMLNQKLLLRSRVSHGVEGIPVAMASLATAKNISQLMCVDGW